MSGENVVLYNFVGGATNDVFTSPAHVMRRIASQVCCAVLWQCKISILSILRISTLSILDRYSFVKKICFHLVAWIISMFVFYAAL